VSNGWAQDKIVIEYVKGNSGDSVTWMHEVRNRFVTELSVEQVKAASGSISISKFKTGPRGWNRLTVEVNEDKAQFYFNEEFIVTLDIDPIDPNNTYFLEWTFGNAAGDSTEIPVYMRHPTIACLE
jgi:hypothetical protein